MPRGDYDSHLRLQKRDEDEDESCRTDARRQTKALNVAITVIGNPLKLSGDLCDSSSQDFLPGGQIRGKYMIKQHVVGNSEKRKKVRNLDDRVASKIKQPTGRTAVILVRFCQFQIRAPTTTAGHIKRCTGPYRRVPGQTDKTW